MQSLPLLIRLAQRTTDEKKCELARIGAEVAEADASIRAHDSVAAAEADAAHHDVATLAAYANWAGRAINARANLVRRRVALDHSEGAARTALGSAFADQKRLELADQARQRETLLTVSRRAESAAEEQYLLGLTRSDRG
jgi:hypothetical protein